MASQSTPAPGLPTTPPTTTPPTTPPAPGLPTNADILETVKDTLTDFENNLVDSLWDVDAVHHKCAALQSTRVKCSAAVAEACEAQLSLDDGYSCPVSALSYNLDRFARACYLPIVTQVASDGTVVDLIKDGEPDAALRAGFECICDECLSSAYPGCAWLSGVISYSDCRKELDCYAGNPTLNEWTTLISGELDCWNVYYYVGIAATILLVILVFYGWFSNRKNSVNISVGS